RRLAVRARAAGHGTRGGLGATAAGGGGGGVFVFRAGGPFGVLRGFVCLGGFSRGIIPGAVGGPLRFSVGLCTRGLDRAVQFYRVLFGAEPSKRFEDHARFELDSPPLVLALYPNQREAGGALNHVGLRLPDSADLVEIQRRLEEHGIATQRQEGVEC